MNDTWLYNTYVHDERIENDLRERKILIKPEWHFSWIKNGKSRSRCERNVSPISVATTKTFNSSVAEKSRVGAWKRKRTTQSVQRTSHGGTHHVLVETAAPEIVGYDDVSDGIKHELDVGCVRRARHVAVDLLARWLVLGFELRLDVGSRLAELLCACKHTSAAQSLTC